MAYCRCCGVFADLDAAKMCDTCRANWQPTGSKPDDLGTRHPGAP
jgi:hypothetical protein